MNHQMMIQHPSETEGRNQKTGGQGRWKSMVCIRGWVGEPWGLAGTPWHGPTVVQECVGMLGIPF